MARLDKTIELYLPKNWTEECLKSIDKAAERMKHGLLHNPCSLGLTGLIILEY